MTTPGRSGDERALSACGGYIRPSDRQLEGLAGIPLCSSSTSFNISAIRAKTPEILAMGEVLQAQLKDVLGLTVHATPTEEKVYLDAERSKHYEVMLDSWWCPWDDPSAYY
jgi:hypothetical protein